MGWLRDEPKSNSSTQIVERHMLKDKQCLFLKENSCTPTEIDHDTMIRGDQKYYTLDLNIVNIRIRQWLKDGFKVKVLKKMKGKTQGRRWQKQKEKKILDDSDWQGKLILKCFNVIGKI